MKFDRELKMKLKRELNRELKRTNVFLLSTFTSAFTS